MENTNTKIEQAGPEQIIEEKIIFSIPEKSHMAAMLMLLFAKEQRLKREEGRYAFENYIALLLEKGLAARDNYLDADEERRNLAAYNKAKERIPLPPPLDAADSKTIEAHIAYSQADVALRAHFKIGGTKIAL